MTPSAGAGISAFTLSVITSAIDSYLAIESPGCLSHLAIVPSVTLSPSCGIVTVSAISRASSCSNSVRGKLAELGFDFVWCHQVELFQRRRERHRRNLRSTESHHRGVETVEAFLGNDRSDFGCDAHGEVRLLHDQHLAALARTRDDRVAVERTQRAKVDDLAGKPICSKAIHGFQRTVHHHSVAEHRDVGTLAHDTRAVKRHRV